MDLSSCPGTIFVSDDCLESWQLIGAGGFGTIHRVKHKTWGMDVAIKLLHDYDGSCSSLLQEADLMRYGENPNVMKIMGVYKPQAESSRPAIKMGLVMEYMERGSLADLQLTLNGPPPWPLTFRIINQIALGMNFLHQLNPPLLHLDLKPSNVLLDDSLNAKLTDFGLSKIAKSTSKVNKDNDEEIAGTTSYMPPEAFESSLYVPSISSDVYSYGILLWSVITGKQPFTMPISSLVRFRVHEGDRPDLTSVNSSQAEGLGEVIELMKHCWHGNPKERPTFMRCTEVTKTVYIVHKQHVPHAVYTILKQLNKKDQSISSFAHTVSETKKVELNRHTEFSEKAQATSLQEIPTPATSGAGMFYKTDERAAPTICKRQYSIPNKISICLSNAKAVQIGNNNYMNVNIQGVGQRQRHPTAPPGTQHTSKHLYKPPDIKP